MNAQRYRPIFLSLMAFAAATHAQSPGSSKPLVFEVENYSEPKDGWLTNQSSATKWNLWTTDKDAARKWSGGVVLQSPVVRKDRATPEEGAPPLHTRITGIPNNTYVVELKNVGRPIALSYDGKKWFRRENGEGRLGLYTITNGTFEVWADDRYAANPPGSTYYDALVFTPTGPMRMGVCNGDFSSSDGLDGWAVGAATGDVVAEIVADRTSGHRNAHIRYDGAHQWTMANVGRLAVKPGQEFTATARARGEGNVELNVAAYANERLVRTIGGDSIKAGSDWETLTTAVRVPDECEELQVRLGGSAKTDVFIDNVAIREGGRPRQQKPLVQGFAQERVREKIGRGIVAMPMADKKIYIGWRLLNSDAKDVAFNLYRRSGSAEPVRLNAEPIHKTTDFVDAASSSGEQRYFVRAVVDGKEGADSETASATPGAEALSYISIKLNGNYKAQKVAIADLDGDGKYDFVIKQPHENIDPYEAYWKRSPETYKLEAYRHDGTFLWQHDLGWSIERGIWYSPYVVYDLDGDGRAEVAVKIGEGDPRDADGRVTSGPEWVAILDGLTGKEKARVPWPSRDRFPNYNYFCRNQLGVAYLDGKTPCLIVERGTYNVMKLAAYEFHDSKLRELWHWSDREEDGRYRGQGAHCLRAADVDGDGRDEVIVGSAIIDDNGVGLWSTGMGHPDHVTVGQLDPSRPGLQIQYGMETRQPFNGICMVDAKTGKILWGLKEPTKHIHSSGLCADIDEKHVGVESYGGERDAKDKRWLFSAKGELIATENIGDLAPRAAYWDASLQRALLIKGKLSKFHGAELSPHIEGDVIGVADILGDWREEIITSLPGELRIYTTTIPAADRRVTLMQDPIYRLDVVGGSQAYYQIPGVSVLPSAKH